MKTYSCIRLCAVALLLLGTSVSLSHAQNDSNRTHDVHNDYLTRIDYKLGLVGGVNFAGAQTLPSPFKNVTAEGATGYVFGIHADMNLVPLFSVQAELLITQRNFQLPSGSSENWSERLTYFQLPLLLKFTPIPGPIQPYVYLGPDIEVRFSAEFNSSVVNGVTNNNVFNSIDVSLGYNFRWERRSGYLQRDAIVMVSRAFTTADSQMHRSAISEHGIPSCSWE